MLAVGGFSIYEYLTTTQNKHFIIDDKYEVDLFADECGFCFLDWQIDFKAKIKDIKTGKKSKYKFDMGNGPYIQFRLPKNNSNSILISGYGENGRVGWMIDLDNKKMEEANYFFDTTILNKFEIQNTLTDEFKIIEN